MNCEKCQELLSDFLDGTLGHSEHAAVGAHVAVCPPCAAAREDFHSIIAVAREARGQLFAPPDERALWLRASGRASSAGAGSFRCRNWPRAPRRSSSPSLR
jgi:predicted anti-sigma-YlaC factor YlaD